MFFAVFDPIVSIITFLVCLTGLFCESSDWLCSQAERFDPSLFVCFFALITKKITTIGVVISQQQIANIEPTFRPQATIHFNHRLIVVVNFHTSKLKAVVSHARRTLPIHIFEPLSLLQAISEELRFAGPFLNHLNDQKDPTGRFCSVIGFIVSGYSGLSGRSRKPFNPLLGETFDFISDDKWKYHAEQVSHHPPISACHADGPGWNWYQTFKSQVQNAMDSTSITSELPIRLFMTNGDEYSWNKVTTVIQNPRATAENRLIRNEGEMMISTNTGLEGRIWFTADDQNSLVGTIQRLSDGVVLFHLKGHWDRGIRRSADGIKWETIFEAPEINENAARFYGFSEFTMDLNCIHESQRPFLPSTDSRLRPDQRHLENGDAQRAEREKKRLEQASYWFDCSCNEYAIYPTRPGGSNVRSIRIRNNTRVTIGNRNRTSFKMNTPMECSRSFRKISMQLMVWDKR
ncbi:Oxysterol-binding protein-related protein 3 [Aphelenchoides besseyi]|nr:Oxysterol-binding protein-related protein 3 [Aphelenchoides besseyi]